MAILLLDEKEMQEAINEKKFIHELSKDEKLILLGFLNGLNMIKGLESKESKWLKKWLKHFLMRNMRKL